MYTHVPLLDPPLVEILAASSMEVLFGSNNHGGDKAADLASLIIAQAALEVPRLFGIFAMVKVSSFLTPYKKSC